MDIADLNSLVAELFRLRAMKSELTEKEKELNGQIKELSVRLIAILKENNMKSHKAPDGGIGIKRVYSVKVPSNDDEKQKLFDWLTEKNMFLKYASVHSRSLQKLYNDELDEAVRRGELDFSIPGVGQPTMFETINVTKGNKDDGDDSSSSEE